MTKSSIPSDWSYCATCTYWSGRLTPKDNANYFVEYDRDEKALCTYWHCDRNAETCKCSNWEPRFRKR